MLTQQCTEAIELLEHTIDALNPNQRVMDPSPHTKEEIVAGHLAAASGAIELAADAEAKKIPIDKSDQKIAATQLRSAVQSAKREYRRSRKKTASRRKR